MYFSCLRQLGICTVPEPYKTPYIVSSLGCNEILENIQTKTGWWLNRFQMVSKKQSATVHLCSSVTAE